MTDRAQSIPAVLRLLLGMVVLAVLSGLLLAGLAIPAVGAIGSVAKSGVQTFNDLPSEFAISPLAQQSRIVDAKGGLIANPYDENRIIVPLSRISPWMQKAQVAIEDSRFYEHGGLDPRGFTRAMLSNLKGDSVQGASTLTQQYVKITLQENALRRDDKEAAAAATAKTYTRKLQELKYALDVEKNFTKDQILTGYLNLVYYGDQAYGVEAAAQNYFAVPASKLTLVQAALLAGIVQQPTRFNPVQNPRNAEARRNIVLDRMQELGMAKAADVAAAKKIPVKAMLENRKPPQGVCQRSSDPYFCAYVMEWLQTSPQMAVLGKTPAERLKNINQGGLTIQTTLDPDLQKKTLLELTKAVPIGNKDNLGAASTVIEPGTGKVLAMAQASDFGKQQVNWNADERYGGGPYGYQFGSTAKMYALVAALERGMPLDATIKAPFASQYQEYVFPRSSMHDDCASGPEGWPVRNDYPVGGNISLAKATAQSINTAFGALVIKLGGCSVESVMTRMGLHQSNGQSIDKTIASIALGAGTTTPMTLAASYATLAARGTYCEPFPVAALITANKRVVKAPTSSCKKVVDPAIADGVNQLLMGPLQNGTAAGVWNMDRPAAGKTGTTNNHNQSWFVGYTPQRAASVWIGNVVVTDSRRQLRTLNHKCFGTYGCFGNVFGGTVAAPVWAKIMKAATEGLPIVKFTKPSDKVVNGDFVSIPSVLGMGPTQAADKLTAAGFTSSAGGQINSSYPAGSVASTDPSGRAMKGSEITLYISTGYVPPPPKPKPAPKPTPKPSATPKPTPAKPTPTPAKPKPTPPKR
jgi:membrane peptidoglycan carboxypeptidase